MAEPRQMPSEQALPVSGRTTRSTDWWGMIGWLLIGLTVFATLIVSYLYLRYFTPEWPPEGIPVPPLVLPLLGTAVLLLSVAPIAVAHHQVWRERRTPVIAGLVGGIVLAVGFFALKVIELAAYEYTWRDFAYGSIFWLTQVLHALFVMAVLVYALMLAVVIGTDPPYVHRYSGVQAFALFWYFTAGIWIALFLVLYLVPRF